MWRSCDYDTGALIALDRNDRHAWARHQVAIADERRVIVLTVALAQAWRDGRTQQSLARLLRSRELRPLDEQLARRWGASAGGVERMTSSPSPNSTPPAIVWTSDHGDLGDELHRGTVLIRHL